MLVLPNVNGDSVGLSQLHPRRLMHQYPLMNAVDVEALKDVFVAMTV